MSSDESIRRLADAAERIADALEFLARGSVPPGPVPRLKVARSPSDASPMEAVTLRPAEGLMTAILQNVGDGDTLVENPVASLGNVQVEGRMVVRTGQEATACEVPAAPDGPGVIVSYLFGPQVSLLEAEVLTLRFPHHGGTMPEASVLEVTLDPVGSSGGRLQWRVVESKVTRNDRTHS